MKPKTINQVNAFCGRNQVIALYQDDKVRTWRDKQYTFFKEEGRPTRLTNRGNFLYGAAVTELKRYCGRAQYDGTRRMLIQLEQNFRMNVNLYQYLHGVYIEFTTNAMNSQLFPNFTRTKVQSNETFESLDIEKYFNEKILPTYLFKEGLLRKIQLTYGCGKKEAVNRYKELKANHPCGYVAPVEFDIDKILYQRIKRKKNILVQEYYSIGTQRLKQLLLTEPRKAVRVKAAKSPSVFEIMEGFDGDIDEVPGLLNSYMDENYDSNTIFI